MEFTFQWRNRDDKQINKSYSILGSRKCCKKVKLGKGIEAGG